MKLLLVKSRLLFAVVFSSQDEIVVTMNAATAKYRKIESQASPPWPFRAILRRFL